MSASYLEDDLRTVITATTAISSIVPAAQVYPAFIRSDAVFPCISITTVGSSRNRNFDDTVEIMKRVQVDVFGSNFPQVKSLELALINLLDGYTGPFVAGSFDVINCHAETIQDSWNVDSSVFRVMIQFEILFS